MKQLLHVLIAALAYYVAGKVGLYLAIPPGFASAVWPAAGIALACLILLKRFPASVGIVIGSFILNLSIVTQQNIGFNLALLTTPLCIGLGATLQANAGLWLLNRLLGQRRTFTEPSDILRFATLVVPLGCIVGASIGATTLFVNNVIAPEDYEFTALTWWIGDSIGVLLFTPMVLTLFTKEKNITSVRKLQIIAPTLVTFGGIFLLFIFSISAHHSADQTGIVELSHRYLSQIKQQLIISNNKLFAYQAFYDGSGFISANDFYAFSKVLLKNDNVLTGLGWTEQVSATDRQRYEAMLSKIANQDSTFTEFGSDGNLRIAGQREIYYPVLYIYPIETNRNALGLDLGSNSDRLKALLLAKNERKAIATAPISLAQSARNNRSVIMYLPIFNKLAEADSEDRKLRGFISGVFDVQQIMGDLMLSAARQNLSISIDDVTFPNNSEWLLKASKKPHPLFDPISELINFGERNLIVSIFANADFQPDSKDWASWSIITIGLFLAAILQSFILLITGSTAAIRKEVNRKTKALNKAMLAAEAANRAKTAFLTNMSHELRTPLNAVTGLITLCLKTELDDKQQNLLYKAKLSASTLLALINHTLDFSKIESGKIELEKFEFELTAVLEKIEIVFSSQAGEKGIAFTINCPSKFPGSLFGDALRLEQLLINLCGNALKFTKSGSISLSVHEKSRSETDIELEFAVEDTGIGIPKNQLPHLFDAFHQVDTSMTRHYGGTGLGLSICKQLVELMGGTIEVISTMGRGSRFSFVVNFPYNAQSSTAAKIVEDSTEVIMAETLQLENMKVLLVEDIEINQFVAQSLLEDHGAIVTVANNGAEAISTLAASTSYDVILMDIQMPVMDGLEATKQILANPETQQIPIVAMTANALSTDIAEYKKLGMQAHVGKPISEDVLVGLLLKFK